MRAYAYVMCVYVRWKREGEVGAEDARNEERRFYKERS